MGLAAAGLRVNGCREAQPATLAHRRVDKRLVGKVEGVTLLAARAVGALADWFGRRRVMVIGLALFGLTSLMVGMAETPTALILGRVAQGLSASAMLILGVALISNAFQGSDRAQAFAIWGVSIGCGAAFGPIVGGILVDLLSWRWIFLLNVPLVAMLITLCYWRVEESSDPNAGGLDWPGIVTFTGALAFLSYGVIEGGEIGWGDTTVVGRKSPNMNCLLPVRVATRR